MHLTKSSKRVRIGNLKPGLFLYKETLCFKSEYNSDNGRCDCYIIESGETLIAGADTAEQFNNLLVTPLYVHNIS